MRILKVSLFCLVASSLFAQLPYQEIVALDHQIVSLGIYNDNLIYPSADGLVSVDLDDPNYTTSIIDSYGPGKMIPFDDFIYYQRGDPANNTAEMRRRKVNEPLTDRLVAPDIGSVAYVAEMAIDNSYLYFGDNYSLYRVSTINIPSEVQFLSETSAEIIGMARNQGALYFGTLNSGGGAIYKLDLYDLGKEPELILDKVGWVFSMSIHNNFLYFIKRSTNPSFSRICRIQLSDPNYEIDELSEEFYSRQDARMTIHDGVIYFSNGGVIGGGIGNKIFKLENVLGVSDNSTVSTIRLYPNPTNETISISGFEEAANFQMFTRTGAKILVGVVKPSEPIAIDNLASGMYYIKIEGIAQSLKFIKE